MALSCSLQNHELYLSFLSLEISASEREKQQNEHSYLNLWKKKIIIGAVAVNSLKKTISVFIKLRASNQKVLLILYCTCRIKRAVLTNFDIRQFQHTY